MISRLLAGVRLTAIGLALLVCVPSHYLARWSRGRSRWPQRLLVLATRASGVKLIVSGTAPPGGGLIVANHRSWLDILLVGAAGGCAFVSKAEIGRWPLVGWLAGMNDTILIERTRRSDVRDQADLLRRALARPKPVALFPEGKTNELPGILPFRASLFAAVDPPPPGIEVWPALVDYGRHEAFVTWPDEEGALANMVRLLGRRGTMSVAVRFLPPIDPAAVPGRKAVALAAQRAVEAAAGLR